MRIWAECETCATPVVLTAAGIDRIVIAAGIDPGQLTEKTAILLDRCANCSKQPYPATGKVVEITNKDQRG